MAQQEIVSLNRPIEFACNTDQIQFQFKMGPKQSQPKKQQSSNSATISHPRFNKVKLFSNKEGEYLQISLPITNETQVTQWANSYKPYLNYECLLLPNSYQFKGAEMCGSSGICKINFPNFPFLLEAEIADRRVENKWLKNAQVWYLVFVILEAATVFHSTGKKIGDVRPVNVFINDHGQAKIANQFSWPHQNTNYQKTVFQKQITYLAPEQIKDQHFGHTQSKANFQIAEAFSIGLTLLDSVLLIDSHDLYDITKHRFEYHKLEERIHQLFALTEFDDNLKKVIAGFLKINPPERLNCRQVFQWLNKYRQQIINIEPFHFQQVPPFFLQFQSNRPVTYIQAPLRPVAQPIYFQSQVVAHSPQRVLHAEPIQFINSVQAVPFNYPAGTVDLGRREVIHPRQVFFEQYSRPVSVIPIQEQMPQGRLVPIQERVPIQEQRIQIPIQVPIQEQRIQIPIQEGRNTVPIQEQRNQERGAPIQQRSIGERLVQTIEPNGSIRSPDRVNQDDFKLTLSKIEEQLALSRKMFPS